MQRKIAEELELDHETIAMFDKQDEEDDFNGVDHGSRDVIRHISQVIARTLFSTSFIMIFLNGSDREVDVQGKFGFSPNYVDHVVLWTFKRRLPTLHNVRTWWDEAGNKLRYTHLLLANYYPIGTLNTSQFIALLRQEAAFMVARNQCMQDIDLTVVTDWCLYCLFLHFCFHGTGIVYWAAQAPDLCLYNDIINSYITKEICDALHMEINWDYDASIPKEVITDFMKDPEAPFLIVDIDDTVYQRRPYRWIWISVSSSNLKVWADMQTTFATASSLFLAFDNSMGHQRLPDKLFDHCNNLQVLILSWCTFSFVLPPFHMCHKLRFLGVDHCNDNQIIKEEESSTEWTFLHNLCVLDMRHTHWDNIISLDKMDLMANLQEINIDGFCCWQYTSKFEERLPNLQRLRITKPTQQAETSEYSSSKTFTVKTKLEILDLSGNRDMKTLPASLSNASSLQVLILDDCDGLENVVSNGLPSLRSFSFDGYGSASHWTSLVKLPPKRSNSKSASDVEKKDSIKISKISLKGCMQLENLFVRGLSNLEELDLSGSAIKILDFETMVAHVPRLRRLFLLGCQHLRAIRWGSFNRTVLDLVCIDTRPGKAPGFTQSSLSQHKSFRCLHAVLADARLGRSLWPLCNDNMNDNMYFSIHITSFTENSGDIQLEATDKEMLELINQQHYAPAHQYGDVLTENIGVAPWVALPHPPTPQLDRHVEIGDGSLALGSELDYSDKQFNLNDIMTRKAESVHVHDVMTKSRMPKRTWNCLRWCRIERCPNLKTIFHPDAVDYGGVEIIWASHLLMARSIWSKGSRGSLDHLSFSFGNLQHLHFSSCPRLPFVLPVWISTFYSLKTIHVIHCGDLSHVLVLDRRYPEEIVTQGVSFPKLTTIHLYNLPKLWQICEVKMVSPALETIRVRRCFSLRQLPALQGREQGMKKPTVEMEKDVWDALEWDGPAAGHCPELYEAPVLSRHYRRRRLLRGTVLR